MTAYGSRSYNTFTYGATPVTTLSVDPFIAYPSNYGTIKVEWTPPSGGSSFVLIRNASGFPTTPDDGDLITSDLSLGSLVDTGSYIDPVTGISTVSYTATTISKDYLNEVKITVTNASDIKVGQLVLSGSYYTGVQGNTLVTNVTGNVITLNKPITIPSGTALTFSTRSLSPGKTYYYSIFAYIDASASWVKLGDALSVSVKDYLTASLMYKYLPEAYTFPADSVASQNTDLFNFLRIFAFEYDLFKTMAENTTYRYNVDNLDARLIPALLNEFGFNYESSMGIRQARKLLKYAADIYLTKGSVAGIKKFIAAFSGYNAEIGTLKNLFLTTDCASFEATHSYWSLVSNTTNTISIATSDGSIVPYIESGSPANYPNVRAGMLKHTSTTGGTYTVKYGYSTDATPVLNPVLYGIPVTAGTAYTFSIYSWAKTTLRSITLAINWYDKDGALLSTSATSSANNSTSAWTRITNTNKTAPTNAVYAAPQITINSTANGEVHYFDAAQFHAGASAITYADARRIDLYLQPNRINHIKNPSFEGTTVATTSRTNQVTNPSLETNSNTYSPANSATIALSTAQKYVGNQSLLVTYAAAAGATTTGTGFVLSLPPNTTYTFSAYVYTPSGSVFPQLSVQNGTITTTNSANATTTDGWQRLSRTFTTGTHTGNQNYSFYALNGSPVAVGGTQSFYLDAVLVESGSVLKPYFDGATAAADEFTYSWTGTANASTSIQQYQRTPGWNYLRALSLIASTGQFYVGTKSALVTADGSGLFGINNSADGSFGCPITVGKTYTFSIYVRDVDTAVAYYAGIEWKNSGGSILSTVISANISVTSSGWTRISVTGTAPTGAVTATATCYSRTAPTSNKKAYFDAALFEESSYAEAYFDGVTGYRNTDDILWENGGTNANARSLYYRNKVSATSRLPVVLPEYLPVWSNWALFTGVPTS
jgi:hypothetical protein